MERFVRRAEDQALALQDLLEARDHYHVHLANLPTVTGTAVGRYRIRRDDANFTDASLGARRPAQPLGPRTLANSDLRGWSWPCVLVFVSEWVAPEVLARHPELTVPPVLYLPDGRQVRTCVVLAERREVNLPPAEAVALTTRLLAPGMQIFADGQGVTRMGVVSALAEDDLGAYAVTAAHVAGDPGSTPYAVLRGQPRPVGRTAARSVSTVALADAYPGFAGRNARLQIDAALVRLDDIERWTARVLGAGTMGPAIDLSAETLSLNLLGCPVYARLPGGHRVEGAVQALFYRHATMGGVDALAELLIGVRAGGAPLATRPGDSGVLWFWDREADGMPPEPALAPAREPAAADALPRPLAVQWGGQGFFIGRGAGAAAEFALATSLAAMCRALGVGLVRDWGADETRYWAKLGHYKIATAACTALRSPAARALFAANAAAISVPDADLAANRLPSAVQTTEFIALADVPDLVWRNTRILDQANHFADMDEKGAGAFAGKTLLALWRSDKASRTPQVWNDFYSSIDPARKPQQRGALPFRVAQLYDVMRSAVRARDLAAYVCAAGVLAHYVGDACQPLHVSYLHHGVPGDKADDAVHAAYEDDMVTRFAPQVVAGVNERVAKAARRQRFSGADAAADAVVKLMRRTLEALPPSDVLASFDAHPGAGRIQAMWQELGARTLARMADGALTLAQIWQSAWTEGGGDTAGAFAKTALATPVPTQRLKQLYDDRKFAESKWLKDMKPLV